MAPAFFERAIDLHGVPDKITLDKSGANTAAIVSIQADSRKPLEMRRSTSSTASSSKTTAPSNAAPGRCSASRSFAAPEFCLPAAKADGARGTALHLAEHMHGMPMHGKPIRASNRMVDFVTANVAEALHHGEPVV